MGVARGKGRSRSVPQRGPHREYGASVAKQPAEKGCFALLSGKADGSFPLHSNLLQTLLVRARVRAHLK